MILKQVTFVLKAGSVYAVHAGCIEGINKVRLSRQVLKGADYYKPTGQSTTFCEKLDMTVEKF